MRCRHSFMCSRIRLLILGRFFSAECDVCLCQKFGPSIQRLHSYILRTHTHVLFFVYSARAFLSFKLNFLISILLLSFALKTKREEKTRIVKQTKTFTSKLLLDCVQQRRRFSGHSIRFFFLFRLNFHSFNCQMSGVFLF